MNGLNPTQGPIVTQGIAYSSEVVDTLPFWRLPNFGMMPAPDLAGGTPVYSRGLSFEISGLIPVASVFGVNAIYGEIRDFRCSRLQLAVFARAIHPSMASESSGQ